MSKHLVSIAPEAGIMFFGAVGMIGAFVLAATEAFPELVGMGAVAAATIGIIGYQLKQSSLRQSAREQAEATFAAAREERTHARELALLTRVSKLEDDAQHKLANLIERQLQCAVKQDAMMVTMADTLATVIESQHKMHEVIATFEEARPCLLKEQIHHHPHSKDT